MKGGKIKADGPTYWDRLSIPQSDAVLGTRRKATTYGTAFFDWPLAIRYPRFDCYLNGTATVAAAR